MGKTKTKFIDDSAPLEEVKSTAKKVVKDELVEKLKAELGIEEPAKVKVEAEEETKQEAKPVKKAQTIKSKPRSKKYLEKSKDLDRTQIFPLIEAIEAVKNSSYTKFDGTLEVHINTIHTGVRGLISLPHLSGKKLRILAFGPTTAISKNDGVTPGDDATIEEMSKGKINFDLVITTPDWMPKLAKLAKFLGPRGLMPNPKNGTIAQPTTFKKAIESFQSGKTEYKTESKALVIHLGIGKLSQPSEELSANIKTLLSTIGKTKIKKVSLSPTMGPSVRLDLSSL